jgi:hypothetical protein
MKHLFILIAFTALYSIAAGQNSKPAQSPKSPKLMVSWGGYAQGNINAEEFKKIVDSAITVKDEKGNKYPVTRFRINYIFLSTYKDSESQMVKSVQDLRVFDFYDTPSLTDVWRSSIRDNAKTGDTILINNLIVKLKNGKKTLAPDFKASLE